ncbi:MAG: signal peptidase I [Sphingobacteriales bacterium]|nr:signal peptidase I [Sphingobacteriales bacterium]
MNWKFWKKNKEKKKKSAGREWLDAVVFAVIAATIIRSLFIEAYTIPTGSMERSLLVGDFLFVSKVNYGARLPMTPIAFPFAHHTMPIIGTKAYWDGWELPYYRLPGLGHVKRNDVVVFNYPMDADPPLNRPVDKRENYIKRCIGISGDTLKIIDAQVYINGKPSPLPKHSETQYYVKTDGTEFNPMALENIKPEDKQRATQDEYVFNLTKQGFSEIKAFSNVKTMTPIIAEKGVFDQQVFPHDSHFPWNQDNYGPIIIPKKGWTVKLDSLTFPIYRRCIEVYEGNKLEVKGNDFYINDKKADAYTFKMNYYWMMGDNRHDSADSRYWGFVPEDHIVGKALFVWMSWDDNASFIHKIRWSRIFMGIH